MAARKKDGGKSAEVPEGFVYGQTSLDVDALQKRGAGSQLNRVLDVDSFARYLAMQVLTANWDGYAMFMNNYRVYHDPATDRITFIPHGMDQTFARATMPLLPLQWQGSVARQYMETRQGQERYRQQIGLLFTSTYHAEELAKRVDELAARVRPILAEKSELSAARHDQLGAALRSRILQRAEFLARQLEGR